ncbi:histidine-type phosphatase [Kitasatospora sp. MBT66]|uniref:histidine-type phosphatase n=1 Tax=Kitasatospora sp. MBT66 TaxID=1444769 RepID=UPI0007C86659|nr:histidine-type phosphatase [Kitasatospora sp. MBT66]
MKRTAPLSVAVAVSTAASLAAGVLLTAGTAAAHDRSGASRVDRDLYGTKAPYEPQGRPGHYRKAPKGFAPVFTENVARHGSRAMSDGKDGEAVLAVLGRAQEQGALTDLGARLAPQVRTLLTAASTLGFGNLSARGADEQRLPSLFRSIAADGRPVVVETSGVARAVASAGAFTAGLTAGVPALAGSIKAPVTDKNLLYFHKQPQNADYQAYLASDPDLTAVLSAVEHEPRAARAARHAVGRLFRAGFAEALSTEEQVAFARSLHALYSAAPDLSVEAPGVDLAPFLNQDDARWLAYLDDAEEFYQSGPAFSGRTITYRMAGVLLDDLLAQAGARAVGTSGNGAVLRFTHAEEIEPLAVLLGLPGSTEQADPDEPYTYRNNPWRGAEVAPMGANIQWDLFADKPADGRPAAHLVRMLYNEKETAFKSSCRPVAKGSYFYPLDELKHCLARS